MAIVFMIFVNDGAGGYWWLEHATWNGLAAGDLVFPAFLWIMGVCIPLSVKSAFAKGVPRWKIVLQIIRVSILIMVLKIGLKYLVLINKKKQLHAVSLTLQGSQRELSVKTLRFPLSAEF